MINYHADIQIIVYINTSFFTDQQSIVPYRKLAVLAKNPIAIATGPLKNNISSSKTRILCQV